MCFPTIWEIVYVNSDDAFQATASEFRDKERFPFGVKIWGRLKQVHMTRTTT